MKGCGYQCGGDLEDGDIVVQLEAGLAYVQHALYDCATLLHAVLRQYLLGNPQRHLRGEHAQGVHIYIMCVWILCLHMCVCVCVCVLCLIESVDDVADVGGHFSSVLFGPLLLEQFTGQW